jgi:hypothetical protein
MWHGVWNVEFLWSLECGMWVFQKPKNVEYCSNIFHVPGPLWHGLREDHTLTYGRPHFRFDVKSDL